MIKGNDIDEITVLNIFIIFPCLIGTILFLRCLRLSDESTAESRAVKRLLGHRLHKFDPVAAKNEWHEILELESYLWEGVSEPYKHTIKVSWRAVVEESDERNGGNSSKL